MNMNKLFLRTKSAFVFSVSLLMVFTVSTAVIAAPEKAILPPILCLLLCDNDDSPPIAATSPLNDTGITWGGDYPSGNNATCTGETIGQQDCSQGRDATHNDDSDGHAGFSFTKIDATGTELPVAMNSWSCVKDNVTGLMWEKKTDDGGAHDKDTTYRWGGITALGRNHASKEGTYYDDWNVLVNAANNNSLCGYNDWRVPNLKELDSIVHLGTTNPAVDTGYFPNTESSVYWSSSPRVNHIFVAWNVNFDYGFGSNSNRGGDYYVRLVR
ncbi:MAG: DUF1566 domain-containing protein [Arenicellales bacterium]